ASALAAIWTLVLAMFTWAGVPVPTEVQAAMVPAVLAAAWLTRAFVTPSWRPRTRNGQDLVPDPAQDMVDHG
ncbi:hypothetical protein, partial [Stomatohabitans albus]|uniref:hypothetical protein n=1 Tax=Stomatohabitans albus TaxID=3110766 RepID=UPI00300D5CCD